MCLWSRPGIFNAKVDSSSYHLFRAGVVAAACRRLYDARAAKLYYFRGAVRLADRIAITDDATLGAFAAAHDASAVWIFLPVDSGAPEPAVEPAADARLRCRERFAQPCCAVMASRASSVD